MYLHLDVQYPCRCQPMQILPSLSSQGKVPVERMDDVTDDNNTIVPALERWSNHRATEPWQGQVSLNVDNVAKER